MAGFDSALLGPAKGRQMGLPTTTVEMTIRCENLSDCDYLSKSDPVVIVFGKTSGRDNDWHELWRSEMLINNLNPSWKKTFTHEYRFEEQQPIKFEVYDWDTDDKGVTKKLKNQDLIGRFETSMASVVSSKQFSAVLRSKQNRGAGRIIVLTEEVSANKEVARIHFAAKDLDKKDTFGKSDAFMVISKSSPMMNGQMTFAKVHETNVVKNSLNPSWDSFEISLKTLCNGDYERPIQFDVYDWDSGSDNDLIGSFTTTFSKLKVAMIEQTEFKVIHPGKAAKKKSYKDSGKVYLKYLDIQIEPTFLGKKLK